MCTLMEKDVLIELIANAQAIVTKRLDVNSPLTEEELRLGQIRDFIYSNLPDDIPYSSIVSEIKEIQGEFEHKPIMVRYR